MIYLGIYLTIGIIILLAIISTAVGAGQIDFSHIKWGRVIIFVLFWPFAILYFLITD